jgi:DNA-binding winged helix-turn-helix (wHTH) protein
MDRLTRDYIPPGRIDLARQADFALGPLVIRPSRRTVEGAGASHLLQRRVMQVLVALTNSSSEVVSQRELILRCWDGLTVSDDAIARCVAELRRLAARWEDPPFTIKTIAGVGYRLDAAPSQSRSAEEAGARIAGRNRLIALVAGAGVAALALATAVIATALRSDRPASPTIAIEPIQVLDGGAGAKALAAKIEDDTNGVLNETGVKTTPPRLAFPFLRAGRQDLMLGGTVTEAGGLSRVRLYIEDRRSGSTLWSEELEGRADGLADQAAALATETVFNVLEPARQSGVKLSPQTLGLYVRALQFMDRPEMLHADESRRDLEQVVSQAPASAEARAEYAMVLVTWGSRRGEPDRRRMADQAAEEAGKAIRQSPRHAGAAYDALYFVQRVRAPTDFAGAEGHLLDGIRAAPDWPFLQMRECQFLDEVGRAQTALPFCQRAAALRPLAPPIGWKYAMALDAAGLPQWAERQMEKSARLNPAQEATRLGRFRLAAFGPSPKTALALLGDEATLPHNIAPNGVAAMKTFLDARAGLPGTSRAQAVAAVSHAAEAGDLDIGLAVPALAQLGAKDEAFALLENASTKGFRWGGGVGFLTDRATASLRADPRYWTFAERLGLVRYWIQSGWPDFCDQPAPRLDCRALAASATPAGVRG